MFPVRNGKATLYMLYTEYLYKFRCSNNDTEEAISMLSDLSISNDEVSAVCVKLDFDDTDSKKVCVLKCTDPVGSPLLGKEYHIREQGGLIGRNPTCEVPLSIKVSELT